MSVSGPKRGHGQGTDENRLPVSAGSRSRHRLRLGRQKQVPSTLHRQHWSIVWLERCYHGQRYFPISVHRDVHEVADLVTTRRATPQKLAGHNFGVIVLSQGSLALLRHEQGDWEAGGPTTFEAAVALWCRRAGGNAAAGTPVSNGLTPARPRSKALAQPAAISPAFTYSLPGPTSDGKG